MVFVPLGFVLLGRFVPQTLMRTFVIVLVAPDFDEDFRFGKGGEDGFLKKLVSEPGMKALSKPVLPGTARRNEMAFAVFPRKPRLQRMGNKLASVIAFDRGGCALGFDQSRQDRNDFRGRKRSRHFNGETLTGEVIPDREHLEFRTALGRVENKVHRPNLARTGGQKQSGFRVAGRLAFPARTPPHLQRRPFPKAVHSVETDALPLTQERVPRFSIAPTRAFGNVVAECLSELHISVRAWCISHR